MQISENSSGVITIAGRYSVAETLQRLTATLEARGVKIFAVVDHSGEAQKAGLSMPDTKLVIFGSPKAGTPLMLATPTIALDLPLKLLIREQDGGVLISFNDAAFLADRHHAPGELSQPLAAVRALAEGIAG